MLGDSHPGPGGDQCRRGRDVERHHGPTPSPAGVDQGFRCIAGQSHHCVAQRASAPGDFMNRFPFHSKRDENRGDLRGARLATHDRAERLRGILGA